MRLWRGHNYPAPHPDTVPSRPPNDISLPLTGRWRRCVCSYTRAGISDGQVNRLELTAALSAPQNVLLVSSEFRVTSEHFLGDNNNMDPVKRSFSGGCWVILTISVMEIQTLRARPKLNFWSHFIFIYWFNMWKSSPTDISVSRY